MHVTGSGMQPPKNWPPGQIWAGRVRHYHCQQSWNSPGHDIVRWTFDKLRHMFNFTCSGGRCDKGGGMRLPSRSLPSGQMQPKDMS